MSAQRSQRPAVANPAIDSMLKATRGDSEALGRLKRQSQGLYLFARAFTGETAALDRLRSDEALELEDLFEALQDDRLCDWLRRRDPRLYRFFEAVKGDPHALQQLQRARKKPVLSPLAQVVSDSYAKRLYQEAGRGEISDDAAADMGCLVGELHLKQGDYHKAIEAFGRAIATNPTIDAYEGRARAYRELAEQDERTAEELRGGT
jgi:tetratricopeptide (TPR) repeat protein